MLSDQTKNMLNNNKIEAYLKLSEFNGKFLKTFKAPKSREHLL